MHAHALILLSLVVHLYERAQGMHPIMLIHPTRGILPGQVALRYMNKVDFMRVGTWSSNSWSFINRKASDAVPLREAEHLR